MELYLQLGHGMMGMSRDLIQEWGAGTVILSPRDLEDVQMAKLSNVISRLPNGHVILDPQFYLPHADHPRLVSHDFWPKAYSTGSFFGGPELVDLISKLKALNSDLGASMAILPGLLAREVDGDWLATQDAILKEGQSANFGRLLCQTIALSGEACKSEGQVASLLEHAERMPADAYYLVCQHPSGKYLVDDPTWLSNVVDIAAGLKLLGSRVLIGYCSHQMLISALAKPDAIASGNWLNVRSFPPGKFQSKDDTKRKAVWYYCPRSLSEYKLPFLDIARRVGVLDLLAPDSVVDQTINALFAGGQPSAIGLEEPDAFRHYLKSLKRQVDDSVQDTFDATLATHEATLDRADALMKRLRQERITGEFRDFSEALAANRATLSAIDATRGPILRREWQRL